MSNRLKYFLTAVIIAAFCALMTLLALNDNLRQSRVVCRGLQVEFADSLKFVTEDDIIGFLDKQYGSYVGQPLDSVDLARIERVLEGKGAVMDSEAWTTGDGMLHISITQRAPAIRFQKEGLGFYADETGFIFPLHKSFTADVPLIEGNIPVTINPGFKGELESAEEKQWVIDILGLVRSLDKTKNLKGRFSSVSVNKAGDIVITAAQGGEKIIFGSPRDAGDKFARLEKYYTHILPAMGEGYYKSINVKYNGQIICRKDI